MLTEKKELAWGLIDLLGQFSNSGVSRQQRLEHLGYNLTKTVGESLPFVVDTDESPRPFHFLEGLISSKGNLISKRA